MKYSIFGIVLFAVLAAARFAGGQMTTGTILGTVHDSTGAVISGATITVTDTNKGTTKSDVSDANGNYTIPFLIPGTYTISVKAPGFKTDVTRNIVVDIDQKARADINLEPGGVTETVSVDATPPLIQLDSSETGDVVDEKQVENLPLNGRDFVQLTYLVPGVTAGQAGENLSGSSSFNPRAASNFNTFGSQANSNAYLVDGIVDNEYTFNTVMVQPSVQSIAEFKVLTGTYSAEYGGGAGVLSTSTRSGSNNIHGEVFSYFRNSAVDARNYFARAGVTAKPAYRRGQFGAAISAPIKKDKVFVFADYYGQRSLKGITNLNSVPTAAERTGDFSDFRNASGALIPIYDPLTTSVDANGNFTRTQFMGCDGTHPNVICPDRLSQVGLNVASIYPLPQTAGSFNNFTSVANQIIDDNGGNVRIDVHLSQKDSLFGRWSYEAFIQASPNPLTGGQGTCCLPTPSSAKSQFDLGPYVAGIQNIDLRAQGLALNETHIFSPDVINEFRAGYARTNPFTFQSDYGHNASTSLGIQGLNISPFTTGLPNITIGGSCGAEFTCLQGGTAFLPAHPRQTSIQLEDNVTLTKGRSTYKTGFRYVRILASPFTNTTTRGGFTFSNTYTNAGTGNAGGSGLAQMLLGFPNSGSRNFLIKPYYIHNQQFSGFVQDDWKTTSRLTLNLGLRYDVFTPDIEKHNELANFDYANNVFIFAGVNGVSRSAGVQTRYGDFGPRIGFAYDVNGAGKTVIRGGFGISYFVSPASASDELGQNPPFTISQSFSQTNYPLPGNFSQANRCTGDNFIAPCQPWLDNPFPQGAVTLPISTLTNTALLNASGAAIVSHNMKNDTPSVQTYTFNIERQTKGGLVSVGYAGSHTLHLNFTYNPNEVEPGPGKTASRRLIQPLNNISTWVKQDPINASNYNGAQVKYVTRNLRGLTALVSYTYSKSLDYGGSAASGGGAAGNPQTITNLKAGYGASGFDQKHRLVSSVNYELPFGPGKTFLQTGPLSYVLGGFEIDAITTYGSGNPFTVTLNNSASNASSSWPNRIGRRGKIDHGNPLRFFDTSLCPVGQTTLADGTQCAFQTPVKYTYGNSARSVLYGPTTKDWDIGLQKAFGLYHERRLAFRLDAFNTFNTPNFSTPNAALGSATAGQITGTVNDNRDLQGSITLYF